MACVAQLNFSDIPEMMVGARPRASAAQRRDFERQSQRLYAESEESSQDGEEMPSAAIGVSCAELEAMFPTLDSSLVRAMHAEAASAQQVVDTLLALAAVGAGEAAADAGAMPRREVGVEDHDKFPLLTSSDGWQVIPARIDVGEEALGSAWRDRARVAAEKPSPKECGRLSRVQRPRRSRGRGGGASESEAPQPLTDYECRHLAGERRAKERVLYSRKHVAAPQATAMVASGSCDAEDISSI